MQIKSKENLIFLVQIQKKFNSTNKFHLNFWIIWLGKIYQLFSMDIYVYFGFKKAPISGLTTFVRKRKWRKKIIHIGIQQKILHNFRFCNNTDYRWIVWYCWGIIIMTAIKDMHYIQHFHVIFSHLLYTQYIYIHS